MERYLQMQQDGRGDRRHPSIAYRDGGHTPRVVDEGHVEMGNMSFFIEGVQNERPVRFSSQQLRGFTQGFAHKVGSGGFGVVYRGRFPNGTPVAVKVLNSTLGRRAEEQFMAEVGTIGRTYHINLVRLYGFCFDAAVKALVYEYMENGSLDRYGMLLFEMLGRRRNLELGLHSRAESQEWYPRWVWHRFEAGEMDAVLARAMAAGELDATEKAARMCKVALWCVQYRPEDRPSMGNVVRMLEGEEQIASPGNPFAHLAAYSVGATLSDDTTTESHGSSAFTGSL
uniref:Protein kinase domain-containing protein n=1 Tax=Aegilops tauschii subsp. strangulata TaxID=200361 RepID=A0A453D6C4_AEGTS